MFHIEYAGDVAAVNNRQAQNRQRLQTFNVRILGKHVFNSCVGKGQRRLGAGDKLHDADWNFIGYEQWFGR